jgi:hypothetical protein
MMKKNFVLSLLVFLSALCGTGARAQYLPPVFAVHVTAPWAFPYKTGVDVEYRIYSQNALLLNYTAYYNYFPGYQGSLQYRLYFNTPTLTENLVYMKLGTGFADYKTSPLFSKSDDASKAPGTYYFGGAGVGKHFNFSHFFFEVTAGLKFTYVTKPPADYNERLFYSIGPGSIPDVNVNFGLQF